MKPIASVIVVTHNHADYLGRCLEALDREAQRVPMEIIVIDNRSDDGSAAVARACAGVRLFVNRRRRGFAANSNQGLAVAAGRYPVLLNPDTEVRPGAIAALVAFMDEHPRVGLCGPRLLFPDGTRQPSARRFPTLASVMARRSPLRGLLRNSRYNRHHLMLDTPLETPVPVDWLLGACLVTRREALDDVGPMDEGYRLYVEDIDWARRMHAGGWDVYHVPTADIVHHHLAVSDRHLLSRRTWIHTRSMVRYTRRHLLPAIPLLHARCVAANAWNIARQPATPPAVLCIHHGAELYGSDRVFAQTVRALSRDLSVHVCLGARGPLVEQLAAMTPRVDVLKLGVLRRRLFTPWGMAACLVRVLTSAVTLARLVRREGIGMVYSSTSAVLSGALAARLAGVPHVWHVHEIVTRPRWFARALSRLIQRHSERVIAVSDAVHDHLRTLWTPTVDRIVTVHNGSPPTAPSPNARRRVRAEFGIEDDTFLMVLVGRVHFWKGQDVFVEAAGRMHANGSAGAFAALVVGDVVPGYAALLTTLRERVQTLGLEHHVTFTGFRHDVPDLLEAADAVVVPSVLPEPFGLVTLEAMQAGRPVVATDIGGSRELVEDGRTGLLVPPGDAGALAQQLARLAVDREGAARMGAEGQRRAEAFSPDRFEDAVRGAVLGVLEESAPADRPRAGQESKAGPL